jgi:hypothetical protein
MPRHRTGWSLAAVAAGLGALSLAGAWPALAGRASSAWNRAALGVIGWIWTLMAGGLAGHGLYARLPAGLPSAWQGSLGQTAGHVFPRLFAPGLLAPAVVWGVGAIALPWITRGSRTLQVVAVTAWSAGLASATMTSLRLLHAGAQARPGAVALGAVAGGIVALIPSLVSRRAAASQSADSAPGLA